jgi:hypothetical protein
MTGHTVHIPGVKDVGGGVLGHISQLHQGDMLIIGTSSGRQVYEASAAPAWMTYGEFARQAGSITDQSVPGRLVLITCRYNGTKFVGNYIVYFTRVTY